MNGTDVLRQVGMTPADIDLLVLHQANTRIIDAAASDLGNFTGSTKAGLQNKIQQGLVRDFRIRV